MHVLTLVSTMRTAVFGAVFAMAAVPALAQDGSLTIQLNKVEDNGANCRMTYVINNGTGQQVTTASYEMAVYGKDEAVMKLIVLDFGALVSGNTQVVQFDLPDTGCKDVTRISVNTPAVACQLDSGSTSPLCSDKRKLETKTAIVFN